MPVIRIQKRENPFVMLDKRPLEDPSLSLRAKGLWTYLMSKPDSWTIFVSELVKRHKEGRDAIYVAIDELIAARYVQRVQMRSPDGKMAGYDYVIHEEPLPENPDTVEPLPGKPYLANQEVVSHKALSTSTSNKDLSKNEKDQSLYVRKRPTKGQLLAEEAERQMGRVWHEVAGREKRGAGGLRRILS